MGFWKGVVWLVARNTKPGSRHLYGDIVAERSRRLGELASQAYAQSLAQRGRDIQYEDDEVKVKVRNGYDRTHRSFVTDIIVTPRIDNPRGSHLHVIFDSEGQELMNEWREK